MKSAVALSFIGLSLASQAHSFAHPSRHVRLPVRGCELEPLPLPPPAPVAPPSAAHDKAAPDEPRAPDEKPGKDEPGAPDPNSSRVPASATEDRADLDVAGTLARVAPKEKMRVTVWAKNRGKSAWTAKNVRIIVRWVDFEAGTRRRWSYNWIKEVVPPMGQMRQTFEVPVPPRAGRYKVIYGLVRLPADGSVQAPPYDASQNKWPGEFAAVAFAVQVGNAPPPDSTQ